MKDNLLSLIPEKYSNSEIDHGNHPKNWNLNWKENSKVEKKNGIKVYCL